MSANAVKDETRAAIIKLRDKGFPSSEIAEMLGVGNSTVAITVAVFTAAQNVNMEALARQLKNKQARAVKWACAVTGIEFSRVENYGKEPTQAPPAPCASNEPDAEKNAATLDDVEASVMVAARLIVDHMTEFEKKLDQLSADLRACLSNASHHLDANADIALQEMRKQTDILGGIKMNTKKKPYNGGN